MKTHTTSAFTNTKAAPTAVMMKPTIKPNTSARSISTLAIQQPVAEAAPWTDLSDGFRWALQIEQGANFMGEAVL